MKARVELDDHFTFHLGLQCPSCSEWESTSISTAFTGKEFTCDCGEEVRINATAFTKVQQELNSLRSLFAGEFELPV